MTSNEKRQQVLQNSKILVQQEQYETALKILDPLDCVEASYMKGKIYKAVADVMANSFQFKFYCTEAQMTKYREILMFAHDHLYRTSSLLPSASHEIQEELNQTLWYEIGKVDNELARTKPMEEDKNDDYDEDYEGDEFQANEKYHIQSMVDHLHYWSL